MLEGYVIRRAAGPSPRWRLRDSMIDLAPAQDARARPVPMALSAVGGTRDHAPSDMASAARPVSRGPRPVVEGRLDRDELRREDEQLIAAALDAAVLAALPVVLDVLDRELTPRLEPLPLETRLTPGRPPPAGLRARLTAAVRRCPARG
jgi:hypothetical protein